MPHDDEDRELRQKSKDNERFEGDTINPDAALHSKEANTRMGGGGPGQDGSRSMADDGITLAGHGPDGGAADVSKNDRDDAAGSDVDDLVDQLMNLDDRETARRYARIILRTGDQLAEIESTVDSIVDAIDDDDHARMNDRIESA